MSMPDLLMGQPCKKTTGVGCSCYVISGMRFYPPETLWNLPGYNPWTGILRCEKGVLERSAFCKGSRGKRKNRERDKAKPVFTF